MSLTIHRKLPNGALLQQKGDMMRSYAIAIDGFESREILDQQGWCFGLPRGISPEQWPMDPANGYPLVHAFTIKIPQCYECHGPEIVAMSFFGPSFMNQDTAFIDPDIEVAMTSTVAPDDVDLLMFWKDESRRHNCLHRMKDAIGNNYAAILLTDAAFNSNFCQLPTLQPNSRRDRNKPPRWIDQGSASACQDRAILTNFYASIDRTPIDKYFRFLLRTDEIHDDPNAGVPVCDEFDMDQTGYVQSYYVDDNDDYILHEWSERERWSHIGGTMRPGQNMPRMSIYYMEVEEEIGGLAIAGGTLQIDFKNMTCNFMK